jgi:glycosyltransferase involved in cell wall biosynthesis
MDKIPKLSIVTPSYNQAAFIAETIESVLSQAGEFEIEYFVMDGGSTDSSVEIIKSYADQVATGKLPVQCVGASMSWVSQRDNGQSDAINQGLHQATGDILSYINSDDLYQPGAFAHVVGEFASHPEADFVYGDGDVIDKVGNLQWEWLSRPYSHSVMTSYHFLWNDFTNYIMQQATFWRRNVVDKIGYFDESFHFAMDAEYWIRAGHKGLKLHHTPHKLGKFRLIQGTKSLSSPTAFWGDYLEIYRRYRGSRALTIFFAYYYRSLADQFDFDWDQTIAKGAQVFTRWRTLPPEEQQAIARQAEWGSSLACFLLADELQRQRRYEKAELAFRTGMVHRPFLVLHPFALIYLLKRTAGPRLSSTLDKWTQGLIAAYRSTRYNYRYHGK